MESVKQMKNILIVNQSRSEHKGFTCVLCAKGSYEGRFYDTLCGYHRKNLLWLS